MKRVPKVVGRVLALVPRDTAGDNNESKETNFVLVTRHSEVRCKT